MLKSVQLYAGSSAVRTVELVDGIGVLRASRSAMVPAGASRMDLDFDIQPGNNYRLVVSGTTDLWRNTGGVGFPYNVATVASITGSSDGVSVYPYFYDWEVEIGGGSCASTMTPVVVDVQICTGVAEELSLRGFNVYPNPSNGTFFVSVHLLRSATLDLELTDMLGRRVAGWRSIAPAGEMVREWDASNLPNGIYVLSLRVEGRLFQQRVAFN
ncbi:MAG: T9SS type A sorting domain-containing protein [Flavobacteriales bacterium]|nr:T9SS type A sorting domain-containing protein [Flavobacteriales bacterium]